jgi:DNA repair protein RadC
MLGALRSAPQECVVVLTLDGNNQVIKSHTITRGLANQSQIHPRETFYPAIHDRAVSILVAHNHPSGNLEPSEADLIATRRLVEVSKTLGIPVLDHLIVAEGGFLSIREKYPAYFG